jgi:ATP-dependent helicase IRC3
LKKKYAPGRKALLFTPTVELAHLMAEAFSKRRVAAEAVDGSLPLEERRAILARLRSGETKIVANCAVLTEGFDEPSVDCVIVARPTRSRILYVQMIGRGTRTFPNKRDCLIVDLVGATERHDLLTLPQLFGLGDATALEERTVTEAVERDHAAAATTPEAPLVTEEVDLFRERTKLRWVEVGERWALTTGRGLLVVEPYAGSWRVVVQEAGTRQRRVLAHGLDLGYAHGVAEDFIRRLGAAHLVNPDARWRTQAISDKQRALLERLGIPYDADLTRGAASDLISAEFAKRELLNR